METTDIKIVPSSRATEVLSLEHIKGTYALKISQKIKFFEDKFNVSFTKKGEERLKLIPNSRQLVNEINKDILNPLKETTVDELINIRICGNVPTFILKKNSALFTTKIPIETHFLFQPLLGKHLCSTCRHLCVKPDEEGGCAKVRDFCFETCFQSSICSKAIADSKRIEKYPFITDGIEVVNCNSQNNIFMVTGCKNYESD